MNLIDQHKALPRGMYFPKKTYDDIPLPRFEEVRDQLPQPIFEQRPDYIETYWFAWEIAYRNLHIPTAESGYVSNFIDAAFNKDIFLWDTAFITMFCNLANPYIPGIRSLDNFYCKQFDDGEIPREMVRDTGEDFMPWVNLERLPLHSYFHNHYGHRRLMQTERPAFEEMYKPDLGRTVEVAPYLTLDNLNHPILAWAEWVSYKHTGDVDRLATVFEPLFRYYESLQYHIRNQSGLYVTDWASMDNNPRNSYLGSGLDISCEMVLFARNLIDIGKVLLDHTEGNADEIRSRMDQLDQDARQLSDVINRMMWNPAKGFYFDVQDNGEQAPVKTIAAYWALISGVADNEQAERLVEWLNDPATFNRKHRVPVCAADEPGFDPRGGYWRGSVWAPTNEMVIQGLEKYGYSGLAEEIAVNHLDNVVTIFKDTGTIWENYPPDFIDSGNADKADFVGWSGIAPILYLVEYGIGIKGDATKNEITWKLKPGQGTVGCNRYWFAGNTIDLLATEQQDGSYVITATSESPVNLKICLGEAEEVIELAGKTELVVAG
ncbi:MGH1-like glycoside hydrolase domain-containing protein [Paenibacillus glycanilyticus]|uniref:Glycoside hydrolase n=1 Tax=Paenibacillus glycanilyticus TaxID=126569 RepID=A0ABQ6G6U4_9BACL|nr:trehalase family glycosidase [Paenibacillus glycanilyticus]GLX66689.1 glycoside hydrolase [Paenibacillus glycanilyticus]